MADKVDFPIKFWEEIYTTYKKFKGGDISLEECYDIQRKLYNSELEKKKEKELVEKPKKSLDKFKQLDSVFEKIKSNTEEKRMNLEKSKAKERKLSEMSNESATKRSSSNIDTEAALNSLKKIIPKPYKETDPTWLKDAIDSMLLSWSFIEKGNFICKECGDKSSHIKHFEKHAKHKHTDYKPFACNICDYAARDKHQVFSHVKVKHNPNTPNPEKSPDTIIAKKLEKLWNITKEGSKGVYDCDACRRDKKSFTCIQSSAFEDHISKNHPGYKPFACNVCPYSGTKRSSLLNHVKKSHYKMLSNLQ